jgi:hypothetical protein
MMTGQHGEVTGVLGSEVRQDGFRLTPGDQDFWTYSPNTTNLWVGTELQPRRKKHRNKTEGAQKHKTVSIKEESCSSVHAFYHIK